MLKKGGAQISEVFGTFAGLIDQSLPFGCTDRLWCLDATKITDNAQKTKYEFQLSYRLN